MSKSEQKPLDDTVTDVETEVAVEKKAKTKIGGFIIHRKGSKVKDTDSSVVIMFNAASSAWAAIDTLHEIYNGRYVDLSFSTRISERIEDLRAIKPDYIIVVVDPSDMSPDFMFDGILLRGSSMMTSITMPFCHLSRVMVKMRQQSLLRHRTTLTAQS